jgi:hypothetical protein
LGWVHASDLGWGRGPKLHGMQGVNARIDLAVPTSRPYCQARSKALTLAALSEPAGRMRSRWMILAEIPRWDISTGSSQSAH